MMYRVLRYMGEQFVCLYETTNHNDATAYRTKMAAKYPYARLTLTSREVRTGESNTWSTQGDPRE